MATDQKTVDFIMEQIAAAGNVRARKMFGEYAIYCDEKVVALVCDNQLFIKITPAGEAAVKLLEAEPPYPGAKPYLIIRDEDWEDSEYLSRLIRLTADILPEPKPRRKRQ